jgi:hypothetical protein
MIPSPARRFLLTGYYVNATAKGIINNDRTSVRVIIFEFLRSSVGTVYIQYWLCVFFACCDTYDGGQLNKPIKKHPLPHSSRKKHFRTLIS